MGLVTWAWVSDSAGECGWAWLGSPTGTRSRPYGFTFWRYPPWGSSITVNAGGGRGQRSVSWQMARPGWGYDVMRNIIWII